MNSTHSDGRRGDTAHVESDALVGRAVGGTVTVVNGHCIEL